MKISSTNTNDFILVGAKEAKSYLLLMMVIFSIFLASTYLPTDKFLPEEVELNRKLISMMLTLVGIMWGAAWNFVHGYEKAKNGLDI